MRFLGAGGTVLAVAACAMTAACGAGDGGDTPSATTSATPSVTRSAPSTAAVACPPAPVVKAPGSGADLRPAINAAAAYLAVRENRLSACQTSAVSWENQVEHLMTGKGWQAHPRIDYDKGALQKKAKRNGWYVRATVDCRPNREMAVPTATVKPLFCGVSDATVDAGGKPVPAGKLPKDWKFHGGQEPAPMLMKKQGGTWLVDLDGTGLGQ